MSGFKYSFTLILFTAIQPLYAQIADDTTYHRNGKVAYYRMIDREKKIQFQYHFYYTGEPSSIEQQEFDSISFTGKSICKAYNMNGTSAMLYSSKDGAVHGLFEEHYADGTLKQTGNFYKGFKTSTWKEYHPNGKLSAISSYELSKSDSVAKWDYSMFKDDSLVVRHWVTWGEEDSALGEELRSMNITKISFPYLKSEATGVWIKYAINGREISREKFDKGKHQQSIRKE